MVEGNVSDTSMLLFMCNSRNLLFLLEECSFVTFSPWTFAVCTVQFVVMFTISGGPNKTKDSCYAYVSQSTRNLRSILKEYVSIFFLFIDDKFV